MKPTAHQKFSGLALLAGVIGWTSMSMPVAFAQDTGAAAAPTQASAPSKAASPSGGAELFDSPQAAVDAVLKAASDYDTAALAKIFGPEGKDGDFCRSEDRKTRICDRG